MLTKFIFVMSVITNEGNLNMKVFDVDNCPDVQMFSEEMNKLKSNGDFIGWNAICIERNKKQQDAMADE
jgi:hypothetical protein